MYDIVQDLDKSRVLAMELLWLESCAKPLTHWPPKFQINFR